MNISVIRSVRLRHFANFSVVAAYGLIACFFFSSVGLAQNSAPEIPSTFFAMTTLDANDFPPLSVGAEAHPSAFLWPFIEKKRGSYQWDIIDPFVNDASTRNIPITLAFGKVPGWEWKSSGKCVDFGGGMKSCPGPPANLDDWKAVVTAVAKHYKGRVQYYEVWNEVNLPVHFTGSQQELVDLAKIAYTTIKSIDPNAKVLMPSMGSNPQIETAHWDAWLTSYLQAGGGQYADAATFHGYTGGRDPEAIVRFIHQDRQILDNSGLRGMPIYDTEGGWGVLLPPTEDFQAGFVARWYILQAAMFASDNLQSAAWYTWGHPNGNNWGVIERPDHTPTQAGLAFNEVYKWLVGATIPKPCTFSGQSPTHATYTCNLERSGGYQAQAVWNTTDSVSYRVPKGFTHYVDLSGNTSPISGNSVMIGVKPILLEK